MHWKMVQWMPYRMLALPYHFPVLFQCKRQPNVCPQLESLCESTAGYVGISVVVSHKYARTQTLTHTHPYTHILHGQQQVGGAVAA